MVRMRAFKVLTGIVMIIWGGALMLAPIVAVRAVIVGMFHGKIIIGLFALGVLSSASYSGYLLIRAGSRYSQRLG
jgi:hypothetical protein